MIRFLIMMSLGFACADERAARPSFSDSASVSGSENSGDANSRGTQGNGTNDAIRQLNSSTTTTPAPVTPAEEGDEEETSLDPLCSEVDDTTGMCAGQTWLPQQSCAYLTTTAAHIENVCSGEAAARCASGIFANLVRADTGCATKFGGTTYRCMCD